jgi:hypothetical protein
MVESICGQGFAYAHEVEKEKARKTIQTRGKRAIGKRLSAADQNRIRSKTFYVAASPKTSFYRHIQIACVERKPGPRSFLATVVMCLPGVSRPPCYRSPRRSIPLIDGGSEAEWPLARPTRPGARAACPGARPRREGSLVSQWRRRVAHRPSLAGQPAQAGRGPAGAFFLFFLSFLLPFSFVVCLDGLLNRSISKNFPWTTF